MNSKTITLQFGNDLYIKDNLDEIPFEHGIYMAYSGQFNGKTVDLNQLLYVGKADKDTFRNRISDHINKDHEEWEKECEEREQIYYRIAELSHDISDTEAAMIFIHKPVCNTQGKEKYIGTRPAPNVRTDTVLPDIDGQLVDILSLM